VVGCTATYSSRTQAQKPALFVQKWDDELCPKVDGYPIFFATMQSPSKDNSGDKVFVNRSDLQQWEQTRHSSAGGNPANQKTASQREDKKQNTHLINPLDSRLRGNDEVAYRVAQPVASLTTTMSARKISTNLC
jgi:hypothetical protein